MARHVKQATAIDIRSTAAVLDDLMIVVVALAACAFGILNGLVQDDVHIVLGDERLRDVASWPRLFASPYWPPPAVPDQYRPVTSVLLGMEYLTGAGSPIVFRLVSYALYAASSVVLYRFTRLLLPRAVALGVALIFAAHPVHVEVTALAVAQSEIVVALLTMHAASVYVLARRNGDGSLGTRRWAAIAVIYATAALTKEQGLFLPGFLLLCELLVPGSAREKARYLWRGFGMLALVTTVIVAVRFAVLGEHAAQPSVAEALQGRTFLGRVVTLLRIFPDWIRLLAWPSHLRIDYSPQEFVGARAFRLRETAGLLLLVATIAAAWLMRRRAPALTFGFAWAGLALLPVSNVFVPTGILIAERALFLPSVGFVIALGAIAMLVMQQPRSLRSAVWSRGMIGAGALLVLLGLARSALRHRTWRDETALTLAAVRDSPRSWRAQWNYGELLFERGDTTGGFAAYRRTFALAPRTAFARNALARRLRNLGDDRRALEQLNLSLREIPGQVEATSELVATLIALGRYSESKTIADRIIAFENSPPSMVMLSRLADSARLAGAPPGAVRIRLGP